MIETLNRKYYYATIDGKKEQLCKVGEAGRAEIYLRVKNSPIVVYKDIENDQRLLIAFLEHNDFLEKELTKSLSTISSDDMKEWAHQIREAEAKFLAENYMDKHVTFPEGMDVSFITDSETHNLILKQGEHELDFKNNTVEGGIIYNLHFWGVLKLDKFSKIDIEPIKMCSQPQRDTESFRKKYRAIFVYNNYKVWEFLQQNGILLGGMEPWLEEVEEVGTYNNVPTFAIRKRKVDIDNKYEHGLIEEKTLRNVSVYDFSISPVISQKYDIDKSTLMYHVSGGYSKNKDDRWILYLHDINLVPVKKEVQV